MHTSALSVGYFWLKLIKFQRLELRHFCFVFLTEGAILTNLIIAPLQMNRLRAFTQHRDVFHICQYSLYRRRMRVEDVVDSGVASASYSFTSFSSLLSVSKSWDRKLQKSSDRKWQNTYYANMGISRFLLCFVQLYHICSTLLQIYISKSIYRWYPVKRALPAMLTHGR